MLKPFISACIIRNMGSTVTTSPAVNTECLVSQHTDTYITPTSIEKDKSSSVGQSLLWLPYAVLSLAFIFLLTVSFVRFHVRYRRHLRRRGENMHLEKTRMVNRPGSHNRGKGMQQLTTKNTEIDNNQIELGLSYSSVSFSEATNNRDSIAMEITAFVGESHVNKC